MDEDQDPFGDNFDGDYDDLDLDDHQQPDVSGAVGGVVGGVDGSGPGGVGVGGGVVGQQQVVLMGGNQNKRKARAQAEGQSFFFDETPPAVEVLKLFPDCNENLAKPQVCSVIADVRIGMNKVIDLVKFASSVRNVEVHPTRKTAVLRLRNPKCSVAVRMGGVVTITGCKNVVAAKRAAVLVTKIIRRSMEWSAQEVNQVAFSVHTTTVKFDLQHPIRLERLASENPGKATYEAESFCGANVRVSGVLADQQKRWNVVATVFASGKVVLLGACSAAEVISAYNALLPILSKYSAPIPNNNNNKQKQQQPQQQRQQQEKQNENNQNQNQNQTRNNNTNKPQQQQQQRDEAEFARLAGFSGGGGGGGGDVATEDDDYFN